MAVEENKAVVRRMLDEVFGQGKLEVIDDLVGPEHIRHTATRDTRGSEPLRQLVEWFRAFLPDVTVEIHNLIGEGDYVAAYFTFHGTDEGGYRDRPPSGQRVAYQGCDIFRFEEGRIAERWGVVDTLSLLYQIGAAP